MAIAHKQANNLQNALLLFSLIYREEEEEERTISGYQCRPVFQCPPCRLPRAVPDRARRYRLTPPATREREMAKRTLGAVETQRGCACSDTRTVIPYELSIPHFCPLMDASVPRLTGFSLNHYSAFRSRVFTRSFGALVRLSDAALLRNDLNT